MGARKAANRLQRSLFKQMILIESESISQKACHNVKGTRKVPWCVNYTFRGNLTSQVHWWVVRLFEWANSFYHDGTMNPSLKTRSVKTISPWKMAVLSQVNLVKDGNALRDGLITFVGAQIPIRLVETTCWYCSILSDIVEEDFVTLLYSTHRDHYLKFQSNYWNTRLYICFDRVHLGCRNLAAIIKASGDTPWPVICSISGW